MLLIKSGNQVGKWRHRRGVANGSRQRFRTLMTCMYGTAEVLVSKYSIGRRVSIVIHAMRISPQTMPIRSHCARGHAPCFGAHTQIPPNSSTLQMHQSIMQAQLQTQFERPCSRLSLSHKNRIITPHSPRFPRQGSDVVPNPPHRKLRSFQ